MTDTDIKALIERLRSYGEWITLEAADALEALQERASNAVRTEAELAAKAEAERDGIRLDLNDCNNERLLYKAEAEAAYNDTLEEAALVVEDYISPEDAREVVAAIRALKGKSND